MACKLNRFTLVILVEIFKKVSVGILSTRNPSALPSTKCSSYPGRIAGIFGRDV